MAKDRNPKTSVALFQEKSVRRVWYQDRWFFSVIDVIAILTESNRRSGSLKNSYFTFPVR